MGRFKNQTHLCGARCDNNVRVAFRRDGGCVVSVSVEEAAVVTWQRGDDVEWIYGGGGVVVGMEYVVVSCGVRRLEGERRDASRVWPEKMEEKRIINGG
ncbi:hypothetical protein Tco_1450216 [Tanacetum coccineum]